MIQKHDDPQQSETRTEASDQIDAKSHEAKVDHAPRTKTVTFQIEEEPPVRAVLLVLYSSQTGRQSKEKSTARDSFDNRPITARDSFDNRPIEERREEAIGLAEAIDLDIRHTLTVPLETTRPATLFGTGKVSELQALISRDDVELVIIDHSLSPGQQRNLERAWNVKILDRTGLILEIFGRRAATKEGRLQVELAHLTYQKSRLVRSWTHLERQRGGRGFLGGPGETQLESDKRQLQTRILRLTKDLEKVKRTRELHRNKRRQVPYPIIALVGYTNAGKSTLFNRLTGAKVMAEDQLFATLDPTMRAITLPSGTKVILSDTVGFVSNLPTQLVAAFRATLEEVLEADIILHVEDASNPAREQQRRDVQDILKDLGLDPEDAESPLIEIWNKSDRLSSEDRAAMKELIVTARQSHDEMKTTPLLISAQTGAGIEALLERLDQTVSEKELELTFTLPAKAGQLVSWLYENSTVQQGKTYDDGSTDYTIKLPKSRAGRLEKLLIEAGIQPQNLVNQDGSLNGSLTVTAAE